MRSWVSLLLGMLLLIAAAGGAAASTGLVILPGGDGEGPPGGEHWPDVTAPNDQARGLVFDGLFPGRGNGPCEGLYEISVPGSPPICTHGPDPAPAGVDVTVARDLNEAGAATAAEAAVPVIGDGVSGNRVQAIYAVPSDRTDRYGEVAPFIEGWAADVDRVYAESAAQVGGERHVRFVTDPAGSLDVAYVVLSPSGDDSISNTISELQALGFNDPSRKYLVWMDAAVYCGIGQIYLDDKPTQDNLNNGRYPMYARVDTGCWGRTTSSEAHELMHMLGGVQPSAPHASANYHCTDESDRMCYQDGPDVVMTQVCPAGNEQYLDCNHDDFYHPNPPNGSYLASHWNTADSSFLEGGPIGDPPPPPPPPGNEAPVVEAGPNVTVTLPDLAGLDGTVSDDGLPDGTLTTTWSLVSGPGTVTFGDASAVDTTASFSAAGTYVLELAADDGELTSADTTTVTVEEPAGDPPPPSDPTEVTETFESSLNRKNPTRSFEVTVADGPVTATLTVDVGKARGKKAAPAPPELTLEVFDAAGNLLGIASGPNPVVIAGDMAAGTCTYVVSGSNKASFTLEVTHLE